jgi:hypothetical protein
MSIQLFYSNWQNPHLAQKNSLEIRTLMGKTCVITLLTPLSSEILRDSEWSSPSEKPNELEKRTQVPHAFPSMIVTKDAHSPNFTRIRPSGRGCIHVI